jgi:hypothetical protein
LCSAYCPQKILKSERTVLKIPRLYMRLRREFSLLRPYYARKILWGNTAQKQGLSLDFTPFSVRFNSVNKLFYR